MSLVPSAFRRRKSIGWFGVCIEAEDARSGSVFILCSRPGVMLILASKKLLNGAQWCGRDARYINISYRVRIEQSMSSATESM
jgi:hypothetical protein